MKPYSVKQAGGFISHQIFDSGDEELASLVGRLGVLPTYTEMLLRGVDEVCDLKSYPHIRRCY
jgi:hypothetical protein